MASTSVSVHASSNLNLSGIKPTTSSSLPSTSSPSSSNLANTSRNQFSRSQIASLISVGQTLVLHRRRIYKLDSWLARHPGGQLPILHFVGRDATCEIEAYHSQLTLSKMKRFSIGWVREEEWYSANDLRRRREQNQEEVQLGETDVDGNWEWNSTNWKPLTPPVQLGYRNGQLEHQMAQIDAWQKIVKSNQQGMEEKEEKASSPSLHPNPITSSSPSSSISSSSSSISSSSLDSDVDSDSSPSLKSSSSGTSLSSSNHSHKERPLNLPISPSLLEPIEPPSIIDPSRESDISRAWLELHEKVKSSGLYDLRPSSYLYESLRYITLGFLSYYFYQAAKDSPNSSMLYLASSFFLGLLWHQLTFTAHDSGHSGITHVHWMDKSIGILIADFIGGLSLGWWCDNHDVHHLVTNHPEHDPDIQHMPFFAISDKFVGFKEDQELKSKPIQSETQTQDRGNEAGSRTSAQGSKGHSPSAPIIELSLWSSYYRRFLAIDAPSLFLLKFQHYLYYPIMSLGRFNLYANSYGFLALKAKRDRWLALEVFGLVFFWSWFGSLLLGIEDWKVRIGYALISHVVTSPLHVQIVLSHFARSTSDLSLYESFPSRQIRTTMDVECPPLLDFIHGGLQMQVTHHLFPRLPRHNLRECRDRFIRPFAEQWGLDYAEYGFKKGNGMVLDTLGKVAGQVQILCKVAEADRRGELHH